MASVIYRAFLNRAEAYIDVVQGFMARTVAEAVYREFKSRELLAAWGYEMNEKQYQPTSPAQHEPEPPEPNQVALALREPIVYLTAPQHRNKPCRCGSGEKFKKCHRGQVVRV